MSREVGILACGAYIPRSRLQRAAVHASNSWFAPELKGVAKGERAIANWDEDSITMAVEAARDALTGVKREQIGAVTLCSTSLPYADRLNAGVVKEALNLSDAVEAMDATGSQRVGVSALIQALKGVAAAPHLCIGAELRTAPPASAQEMAYGDAAAAVLVGAGAGIARFLGSHSVTVDFVDHYRAAGEAFDYVWESRWIRDEGYMKLASEALQTALAKVGLAGRDIDCAAIAISARGVAEALAKKAGIRPGAVLDTYAASVGDCGVAHPLVMLTAALEQAKVGDKVAVVAFGQGLDIAVFEVTASMQQLAARKGVAGSLQRRKADSNYPRYLFHRGLLALDRGMRAEQDQKQPGSAAFRNRKTVLALVGGRCTKTGVIQFPKSDISVNPDDHTFGTQEDYPLAEVRAKIVTYTADSLTYSPDPPNYYGIIDFDGGGRLMAEFADVDAADVEVGREMRMVFRIKAVDETRHFKRYFWKATPAV